MMVQRCVCVREGGSSLSPTQLDSLIMKRRFVLSAWKAEFLKRWFLPPDITSPHTDFYGCESALPLVSQADFTAPRLLCELVDEQTMCLGIYLHKCVAPQEGC